MKNFEKLINQLKIKQNSMIIFRFLLIAILLSILFFNIFFAIFNLTKNSQQELFIFALILKILLISAIIYLIFQTLKSLKNKFKIAKYLDEFNNDKSDTYQNALELLHENPDADSNILKLIYRKADIKAESQILKADSSFLKRLIIPFILVVVFSGIIFGMNLELFSSTFRFFSLLKLPPVSRKDFVELEPGNLSVLKNTNVSIEVINPEPEIEHKLFYRIDQNWREIILFDHRKTFNNLDFSFDYFIETPFAISDTFKISVFENPIIKNFSVKYGFPAYTGMESEYEEESNGHIKAISGTKINLQIEANNPIETATMFFSNGDFQVMDRIGKATFGTIFTLKKNGSYNIDLIDFLKNKSKKISKSITVIPDKTPEIKIVKPGKDTLITQNMLLPLEIFAADDFGLKDLTLHYYINYETETVVDIQKTINGNVLNLDYVFDLNDIFLIPGDNITYWLEIFDNSPQKQKATSRKYNARFPSIEEIYREIEEDEELKAELMENTLERSKELQEKFEEKRRELMKKEEVDWEDKQELEKFLEKQEELNKEIENIAEDYQELIEKFEDNRALSKETLEKMEKIRELMEEISNEELEKAMEELRQKMEELDPDVLQKAMEDFKFSMEDFSKKLEQTIKLLEDIKKEQALQKALEIAEEMEEMQENLNQRTENQEADNEQLSKEQQNISEKLESLEEQLEKTDELLNDKRDEDVKKAMEELQEQMEQDSLSNDLQESMENLQQSQMQKAQKSQQSASSKMKKMTQKLSEMKQMMSSGSMMEIGEILQKTIRRLLIFSQKHEESSKKYANDPFQILAKQLSNFEGINLSLKELYSIPMIVLYLGPKFVYDANFTSKIYRELFQHINDAGKHKVRSYLSDIQKGINLMIYDLMQSQNNMQQSSGGG